MSFDGISSELDTQHAEGAAAALRTTVAVRTRARHLLERARIGASRWFTVDDDALQAAAVQVAELTRERYPSLVIPFHSRWRHFEAGGIDRKAQLDARLAGLAAPARARAMIDLALVSVLLDAGAGPTGATTRLPAASASRAPKGWRSPASTPSWAACSPATPTSRCRSTLPACVAW